MNYHVTRNGQSLGELPESEILARLGDGTLSPGDLARREGMSDWEPLHALFPYHVGPGALAAAAAPPARADFVLAGPWIRLGAALLNTAFALLAMAPVVIALWRMGALLEALGVKSAHRAALEEAAEPGIMDVALIIGGMLLSVVLLIVQLVFMTTRGQSLGKMICGIRVVDERGQVPGFWKMVVVRAGVPGLIGSVPLVGRLFTLVDSCFIFFREDYRCVHDMMASTYVVEGRPRR